MTSQNSLGFIPNVPGSRSIAARALICAGLAGSLDQVSNSPVCDDTDAIRGCLAGFVNQAGQVVPTGQILDCNASGTTMRFIAALSLLTDQEIKLTGTKRLLERPMDGLVDVLSAVGKQVHDENGVRIISGKPSLPMELTVDASKSGQFVSGLLMALGATGKQITLRALNPVSIPFITMTVSVMQSFGAQVSWQQDGDDFVFELSGSGYQKTQYQIEPDIMSANYFLAAALITGKDVFIPNIKADTIQGDVAMVYALEKMGATITFVEGGIKSSRLPDQEIAGCTADLALMPDMSLTLAALASIADSPTTLTSARILEYKESDRLGVIVSELTKLGAKVEVSDDKDTIQITPALALNDVAIDTFEDHRVAMAFGLLTLVNPNIVINDPECVSKTWPNFFAELARFQKED